jgi:hypothetical protein
MDSARKSIGDETSHAPPQTLWATLDQFYERIERDEGLVPNRSKTQVYSPNGHYAGMPQAFQIGKITATLTGEDGVLTVITAQGLAIWGVALSNDGNYIKAATAIKAEKVYKTINKVTNSYNPLSKNVNFLAVLRLNLQPRAQYHQQTHQPNLMESANERIQQPLDRALELATCLDFLNPAAYSQDPVAPHTSGPRDVPRCGALSLL